MVHVKTQTDSQRKRRKMFGCKYIITNDSEENRKRFKDFNFLTKSVTLPGLTLGKMYVFTVRNPSAIDNHGFTLTVSMNDIHLRARGNLPSLYMHKAL